MIQKKIDETKVKFVVDLIQEVINKNEEYQHFYKTLNKQERVIAGSVFLAAESPYAELTNITFMGEEFHVTSLIDRMILVYKNRNAVPNSTPMKPINAD